MKLLKGTYVQVSTWPRHRNTKLWGDDAHVFNPDRAFAEDELWGGDAFMGGASLGCSSLAAHRPV